MFQTEAVQKFKTHILCSVTFFRKLCRLWDNVEEYCTGWHGTYDNMAHAHCMLNTYGYKDALRIFNTDCFSTATMVARTRSLLRYTYTVCLLVFSLRFEHSDEQHAIFPHELQSTLRLTLGFSNVYCELWQICHFCVKNWPLQR